MSEMTQLDKTAGAVGCAHCRGLGAAASCAVCGRPVCPACASPARCPEPVARELRLGLGRRLWDVDHEGRLGIVCSWNGRRSWLFDLAAQRARRRLPSASVYTAGHAPLWPRLGPDGLLLWTRATLRHSAPVLVRGSTGDAALAEPVGDLGFATELVVGDDGEHVALRAGGRVEVRSIARRSVVCAFDAAADVHSVALSAGHDLLAVGLWQQVRLLRLSRAEQLGALRIGAADVAALEVGGGRLAAITEEGDCRVVQIDPAASPATWRTVCELSLPLTSSLALAYGDTPRRRRVRASLSADGALLAVRVDGSELLVVELASGARQHLRGHSDRINLVRFVASGALLSADLDNRVICWPRVAERRLAERVVRLARPR